MEKLISWIKDIFQQIDTKEILHIQGTFGNYWDLH